MRTLTTISGLFRHEIGDDLFNTLASVYPEGVCGSQRHAFRCMLPSSSTIVKQLLDRLNEAGMTPHTRGSRRKDGREYTYVLHRRYDYSDLKDCKLVECMPLNTLSHPRTDENGSVVADAREFSPDEQVKRSFIIEYRVLVRDDVKSILQSAHLSHVRFKPIILKPQGQRQHRWCELFSDIIMPPLSPSLTVYARGQPVERGYSGYAWGITEGVYAYPELRYLRSDIESLEPCDLALTHEGQAGSKRMVASHRFFETCIAGGLDTNWLPVHVDEG